LWFVASLVVFIEDDLIGAVNSAFFVVGFLSDLGLGFMVTLLFSVFFLLRVLRAGTVLLELGVQVMNWAPGCFPRCRKRHLGRPIRKGWHHPMSW
jgi:hypothetical protein